LGGRHFLGLTFGGSPINQLDAALFQDAPDRLEIDGLRRGELTSKSMMTFRGTSAISASCACVMKAMPRVARHWAGVILNSKNGRLGPQ
jgi:hypothetical protein